MLVGPSPRVSAPVPTGRDRAGPGALRALCGSPDGDRNSGYIVRPGSMSRKWTFA